MKRCERLQEAVLCPCPSCTTPIGAKRQGYEYASCLFTKSDMFLDVGRYSIVRFGFQCATKDFQKRYELYTFVLMRGMAYRYCTLL